MMKPKYLNPLIDYIFKKIFGDEKHKEILISFLNSLEIESQGRKIVDLQILNNANEKRFKRDKFSILDIKAKLDNGDLVNIEVQILPYDNMLQRTMYYWAKLYSDQLNQGEDYGALNNTVVVNVLGYNQFPHKKIHSVYQIRDKESGEKLGDFLEIHFLETRKIEESQQEINEDLKGWLLFLSDPESQRLMRLGKEKEEMGKAINLLEELSRSREERAIAEEREKALRDELSFRKAALEKGLREGRAEGREEGREEGRVLGKEEGRAEGIVEGLEKGMLQEKLNTAKKLLQKGMALSEVAEITGLSSEEIEGLR